MMHDSLKRRPTQGKASKLPIENVRAVSLNGRTLVLGTSLGSVVVWDLGVRRVYFGMLALF